ncbi:hypothetical protein [Planctomicrobium piriforme]|uniref:Uncharacterized protein n=1 Tax=Planctomicrobium piriforme TaxID=1576369 RepID=A0A1I3TAB2_9PLAN|nr:hypothetical protein [Planctomicrobium piriforme]SFJ67550.1 hypothetical protein SAMN05421753_12838 [Planctomicrobium piriforme]
MIAKLVFLHQPATFAWLTVNATLVGFVLAVASIVAGVIVVARLRRTKEPEATRAQREFHKHRERLQSDFFQLAAARGKPRGLRWTRCDWKPDVVFATDLATGLLTAFVDVEIHFEAIPGGDMEEVEAVGHFREASAVFHCQSGQWGTGGKALFNMRPAEAVTRLAGQYEML